MLYQGFQPVVKKSENTIRETSSPTLADPLDEGVSFADPTSARDFVAGGAMEAMTAPAAIAGDTDKMETPSKATAKPTATRNTAVNQVFTSAIPSNGCKGAPRKRSRSRYVARANNLKRLHWDPKFIDKDSSLNGIDPWFPKQFREVFLLDKKCCNRNAYKKNTCGSESSAAPTQSENGNRKTGDIGNSHRGIDTFGGSGVVAFEDQVEK